MNLEQQQKEVNSLTHRARMYAFFWAAGFGSLRAVGYANQALKLIRASDGQLKGESGAKFARGVGIFGMLVWFPFIVLGIIVSLLNK
jgi:hypothetical protein